MSEQEREELEGELEEEEADVEAHQFDVARDDADKGQADVYEKDEKGFADVNRKMHDTL